MEALVLSPAGGGSGAGVGLVVTLAGGGFAGAGVDRQLLLYVLYSGDGLRHLLCPLLVGL